jgi:hypothetical protein
VDRARCGGALLLAFIVKPGLTNYGILAHHVSLGHTLKITGRHALSSILMFAVIPVAIVAAMMMRADNWRDQRSGPVLVTLAATIVVLFPVIGRFEAFATSNPVDRYVIYLAPLLFLAFTLAPGRVSQVRAIAAIAIVAALLLLAPIANNYLEQPALFGLQQTLRDLGFPHVRLGAVAFLLPLMAIAVAALTSKLKPTVQIAIATATALAVMLPAAWTSQKQEIDLLHSARYQAAPRQLQWVDPRVHGDVATLDLGQIQFLRHNFFLYTDLFNKRVSHIYSNVSVGGGECNISVGAGGRLSFGGGYCPPWPRYLVVLPAQPPIRVVGERLLIDQGNWGRLVEIPPGPPRVVAR